MDKASGLVCRLRIKDNGIDKSVYFVLFSTKLKRWMVKDCFDAGVEKEGYKLCVLPIEFNHSSFNYIPLNTGLYY